MENTQHRKRVPERKRRNHDWRGLPQMIVAVSNEPEYAPARSLTSAFKYLKGEFVSAPMERIKQEAMRRLGMKRFRLNPVRTKCGRIHRPAIEERAA
jgi:hypothetical protein